MNSVMIFSIAFLLVTVGAQANEQKATNNSDKIDSKISKNDPIDASNRRLSLRERREARKKEFFKNKPPIGIRPLITEPAKISINNKVRVRQEGFVKTTKNVSIASQKKNRAKQLKRDSQKRSAERNIRTRALLRRKKRELNKIAHQRRRELERQRRERLIQIQQDLIRQNRIDQANDLNRDI
jgi:hypothetical protein